MMLWYNECNQIVPVLAKQAMILSQSYFVAITNPPYMGISNGSDKLIEYVKREYPDSKTDFFAVFIEKCKKMLNKFGYQAMITQHAWMFLSSYEKLREKLNMSVMMNMAHLGARAFDEIAGEVVQTTSFVMLNYADCKYRGTYLRLVDASGERAKEEMFLNKNDVYFAKQESFQLIPGVPYAYWLSDKFVKLLAPEKTMGDVYQSGSGLSTADNNRFLRCFWEVDLNKIADGKYSDKKWFLFQKGGEYRKWYGNLWYIVNWENDGEEIKYWVTHNPKDPKTTSWSRRIFNTNLYFEKGITWSVISSGDISFRVTDENAMISNAAGGIFGFATEKERLMLLAGLNSKVWTKVFATINPTLNYSSGVIQKAPVPQLLCEELCNECVELSKADWDSFETSWDYKTHPFIRISKFGHSSLKEIFAIWENECDERFIKVKQNEEEINRQYISYYGLESELTPEVLDEKIIIKKADKQREIRSFISFAVGCIMGRYSLDSEGIVYAGGRYDEGKYVSYVPDKDGILLISDEEYFEDIVTKFIEWLKVALGEDSLEDNLDYIAENLGVKSKNDTSRNIIRYYFVEEFFAQHCNDYSVPGSGKRPIYWLFDSGKQNGFKALVYMHRYSVDTIGNVRVDYLHRIERIYESEIGRMQDTIDNSRDTREVASATRRKEKLQKQLKECQEYDEKIGHLALSRIGIDLDDGVKANYEKIQIASDGKKYSVLKTV